MQNNDINLLDTNILLRYFLCDDDEMYKQACYIIDHYSCVVLTNIVQEIVYILSGSVYQIPRLKVKETIVQSFSDIYYTDREIIEYALEIFTKQPKLDFPDCMLLAYHRLYDIPVSSFDQKLNKQLSLQQ